MTALATIPTQAPAMWNDDEYRALKASVGKNCTDAQFVVFMKAAALLGLNPFARQIVPVVQGGGMTPQVTIDGFRLVAERSGDYLGQVGPMWCGADGVWVDVWLSDAPPVAAKVGVLRRGWKAPMWGVARLKSYSKSGVDTWVKLPDVMLAKVAEALALRKAFPMSLSGAYVREELDQMKDAGGDEPTLFDIVEADTTHGETAQQAYNRVIDEQVAAKKDASTTVVEPVDVRTLPAAPASAKPKAAPKPPAETKKPKSATVGSTRWTVETELGLDWLEVQRDALFLDNVEQVPAPGELTVGEQEAVMQHVKELVKAKRDAANAQAALAKKAGKYDPATSLGA